MEVPKMLVSGSRATSAGAVSDSKMSDLCAKARAAADGVAVSARRRKGAKASTLRPFVLNLNHHCSPMLPYPDLFNLG
jgi:hypothetical protein